MRQFEQYFQYSSGKTEATVEISVFVGSDASSLYNWCPEFRHAVAVSPSNVEKMRTPRPLETSMTNYAMTQRYNSEKWNSPTLLRKPKTSHN